MLDFILSSKVWKLLVCKLKHLVIFKQVEVNLGRQAVWYNEIHLQDQYKLRNVIESDWIQVRLYIESHIKSLLSSSVIYLKLYSLCVCILRLNLSQHKFCWLFNTLDTTSNKRTINIHGDVQDVQVLPVGNTAYAHMSIQSQLSIAVVYFLKMPKETSSYLF